MHHPEIYDIISIIEDYYILTDAKFRCWLPDTNASKADRDEKRVEKHEKLKLRTL
jgi:hypothetical protein